MGVSLIPRIYGYTFYFKAYKYICMYTNSYLRQVLKDDYVFLFFSYIYT